LKSRNGPPILQAQPVADAKIVRPLPAHKG
jgi:hypothetical protein